MTGEGAAMGLVKKMAVTIMLLAFAVSLYPILAFADDGAKGAQREASAGDAAGYKKARIETGPLAFKGITLAVKRGEASAKHVDYQIEVIQGGTTGVLASGVGGTILSDGRYLFYSKNFGEAASEEKCGPLSRYRYVLYQLDLQTGKKKRLVGLDCCDLIPEACDGDYVYCSASQAMLGKDLYAVNTSSRGRRFMAPGVSSVAFADGRVIVGGHHNVGMNRPVFSFGKGGMDKMQIAEAMEVKTVDGCVHYIVFDENKGLYQEYTCSPTGEDVEAVTDWTTEFNWREWQD